MGWNQVIGGFDRKTKLENEEKKAVGSLLISLLMSVYTRHSRNLAFSIHPYPYLEEFPAYKSGF